MGWAGWLVLGLGWRASALSMLVDQSFIYAGVPVFGPAWQTSARVWWGDKQTHMVEKFPHCTGLHPHWGHCPKRSNATRRFACPFVPRSQEAQGPASQPARQKGQPFRARASQPGLRASQPGLRANQPVLRASQPGPEPASQASEPASQTSELASQASEPASHG